MKSRKKILFAIVFLIIILIFLKIIEDKIKVTDYASPYLIYDNSIYTLIEENDLKNYNLENNINDLIEDKIGNVVVQYADKKEKCVLYSCIKTKKVVIVENHKKYYCFLFQDILNE